MTLARAGVRQGSLGCAGAAGADHDARGCQHLRRGTRSISASVEIAANTAVPALGYSARIVITIAMLFGGVLILFRSRIQVAF